MAKLILISFLLAGCAGHVDDAPPPEGAAGAPEQGTVDCLLLRHTNDGNEYVEACP